VTEDIAYDFDIGPRINLPACMAVPKRVRTVHLGRNAGQSGVVPDAVSYRCAAYGLVGHVLSQEKGA
jgi:hypothetical protein